MSFMDHVDSVLTFHFASSSYLLLRSCGVFERDLCMNVCMSLCSVVVAVNE